MDNCPHLICIYFYDEASPEVADNAFYYYLLQVMVLDSYRSDTFGKFKVKRGFGVHEAIATANNALFSGDRRSDYCGCVCSCACCVHMLHEGEKAKQRNFSEISAPFVNGDCLEAGNISQDTEKAKERRSVQQQQLGMTQQQFYFESPYDAY